MYTQCLISEWITRIMCSSRAAWDICPPAAVDTALSIFSARPARGDVLKEWRKWIPCVQPGLMLPRRRESWFPWLILRQVWWFQIVYSSYIYIYTSFWSTFRVCFAAFTHFSETHMTHRTVKLVFLVPDIRDSWFEVIYFDESNLV